MLTIIHGSDISASRNYFVLEKQKNPNALTLSEKEVELTGLAQILEGAGLFEDTKTLFIEQFISDRKKSKDKEGVTDYLIKNAKNNNIIMWEGKELTASQLSPFKGASIKIFKLPPSLFSFLDSLKPGNSQEAIKLHHLALEANEPEMIFFMLIRQFRLLLALSQKSDVSISEIIRMSPWQKTKIEKQAKLFDTQKLLELYSKLFMIETAQKTGNLETTLASKIDFFILEI